MGGAGAEERSVCVQKGQHPEGQAEQGGGLAAQDASADTLHTYKWGEGMDAETFLTN